METKGLTALLVHEDQEHRPDPVTISQSSGSDTINGSTSAFSLPAGLSISLSVNNGATGFDLFYSSLLELSGSVDQAMTLGVNGPTWANADLVNPGSDLYLYYNFT